MELYVDYSALQSNLRASAIAYTAVRTGGRPVQIVYLSQAGSHEAVGDGRERSLR